MVKPISQTILPSLRTDVNIASVYLLQIKSVTVKLGHGIYTFPEESKHFIEIFNVIFYRSK